MNKQQAYIGALELAIRALDSAFVRANAAEVVRPLRPLAELWQLSGAERDAAERADLAAYDVAPDHWGARLALMSAFEALHAALRVAASRSAYHDPQASAWRDATARAQEASRLACEAARVFHEAGLPPRLPRAPGGAAPPACAPASAEAAIASARAAPSGPAGDAEAAPAARAAADPAAQSGWMHLR
ncbi:hypothetical protein [Xenophilus sp. Marseille-Q4582]|uniref:hypothetical protein n=1 Tax=Xenophilus sp. Marseille-Q4582 TaxID=2866600 RepID=UPI001CE4761E|nr:hypothetical protein [Xenophilus sp. Marseille-Q4582]